MAHAKDATKVAFVNPAGAGHAFWGMVESSMRGAAKDLNIDLEVTAPAKDSHRFEFRRLSLAAIAKKPDYLVTIFMRKTMKPIFDAAEKSGVKIILFNNGIPEEELKLFGKPREKYQCYLGSIYPDDVGAGKILAQELLVIARQRGLTDKQGNVQFVGINGARDTTVSYLRLKGLKEAIQADPNAKLNQSTFTDWTAEMGVKKATKLLKRYPETTVIWTAADFFGLACQDLKRNVLTGGIDWTPEALKAIRAGKFATSVGGHFAEGAWVLVLAHDHHNGVDFAEVKTEFLSTMAAITTKNCEDYSNRLSSAGHFDAVDFRCFSRLYGLKGKPYNFDVNELIRQLPKASSAASKQ